jgi:hypothetical protein
VKLTTHLQLVSRSRNPGSIRPLPIRLQGVVLNYLSTRTTVPLPYALRRSLLSCTSCNVECGICNCKLAVWIDLRRLRWNASIIRLTFTSEVRVFLDFARNGLPAVLSFFVPEPNAFLCRMLNSILCSETTLDSCNKLQLC